MVMPPASDTDRHLPASRKPFVGRERELNRFRAIFDRVRDGHGYLVLVSGEAGIGKTTLMTTVIELSSTDASLVLTGHCYDLTTTRPYGPWLEILQACRRADDLPLPDTLSNDEALATAANQSVLFDTFVTFFQEISADRLLILMLEDMHWADQASLDLLRHLTRQIDQSRILVVVSYRDDEITRRHPLFQLLPVLVREAPVERLQLRRLEADNIRELVAAQYDLSGADADQLTRHLVGLSDGNPFFVHELLTALEDERILRVEPDGVTIGVLGKIRTPPLLKQVIERRLSRLDATTRSALEVAAVVGQDVPLDVWQAVTQIPEEQLDTVVQEALDHRILEESSAGSSCRFTHALVRETLIEGIALPRRRRWHRHTAETLTLVPAADPDTVAYHFQQAGDARAVDWLIQAGERAQRAHAWFTAADRFEAAVGLLEMTPERDRERGWLLYRISQLRRYSNQHQSIVYLNESLEIASTYDDQELTAAAQFGRGLLRCFVGDLTSGLPELEAATIANERLGYAAGGSVRPGGALDRGVYALWLAFAGRFHDAIAVARQHLSSHVGAFSPGSYRSLALAHSFLGQLELAREAFAHVHAIAIANHADPPNVLFALLEELMFLVLPYHADDLAARARLMAECDMLRARASASMSESSPDVAIMALLLIEGRWDRVSNLVADPLPWTIHPLGDSFRRIWAAVLTHHQGHPSGAWKRMQELLPDGPPIIMGRQPFGGIVPMQHLTSQEAFDAGDLEIAHTWLTAFDQWLDDSGAVLGRAENAVLWAHYYQAAGDHAQARELAARALRFASNPRQPLALIAAHRTIGQLETIGGHVDTAEHHLQEALTLADACTVPFDRALVMLARATLQTARGDHDDARASLGEVVSICERLSARPTLERAKTLLASLDVSAPSPDRHGGLSAREIDVLGLIVDGKTDREIAANLFISPRTVTTHVTHILNKLGVSTRTEAAACAVREGLI